MCVCLCVKCVCVFRFGYFGRAQPEVVRLLLCVVCGGLTDGQVLLSASGEEMLSFSTRDTRGIRMLQEEGVEVTHRGWG